MYYIVLSIFSWSLILIFILVSIWFEKPWKRWNISCYTDLCMEYYKVRIWFVIKFTLPSYLFVCIYLVILYKMISILSCMHFSMCIHTYCSFIHSILTLLYYENIGVEQTKIWQYIVQQWNNDQILKQILRKLINLIFLKEVQS